MAHIPIHRGDRVPPESPLGPDSSDCGALTDVPLGYYALSLVTTPHTPVGYLLYHTVPIGQLHRLPYRQFLVGKNQTYLGTYLAVPCDLLDDPPVDWTHRLLRLGLFIPPDENPFAPDEVPL